MTFNEALERVCSATSADDIPNGLRRRLLKLLHPDTAPADRRVEAEDAIRRLNALFAPAPREIQVSSRRSSYRITVPAVRSDDLINVYSCTWKDEVGEMKVARTNEGGRLLRNEARALTALGTSEDDGFRIYVPRLVESFRWRITGRGEHRANVLAHKYLSTAVPLSTVNRSYPLGIDPRDTAWMWRRLLAAASWWQSHDVAHTNLSLDNVLIIPEEHGLVATDWYHAPESVTKESKNADVFRIGLLMLGLTQDPPRQYRAFVRGCVHCDDAAQAHGDFTDIIERLWGPRTFRPFSIPGIDG